MMNRRIVLLIVLSASILLAACGIRRIRVEETTDALMSTATGQTTGSQESTAATPTPTSKPTPKPTAKPTSKPTPTPTPSPIPPPPEVTYIPREPLPAGQLFDKKYYAILPGEGTIYYVYDCYGKIIHSFTKVEDWGQLTIGLFEKHEIERYTHIPASKTESDVSENRRYFTGGYYEWPSWELNPEGTDEILRIVTDKGKMIRILRNIEESSYAEWNMVTYPDATGISVIESIWTGEDSFLRFYYLKISSDGTVIKNLLLDKIPDGPLEMVGDKYIISTERGENGDEISSLMDLSGKVILEDVTSISSDYVGWLSQSWVAFSIGDYFVWNGRTFDDELKIVPDETRTPDGLLIPGVRYYVDGILCQNEPQNYWEYSDLWYNYAVGTDGESKIAIKSIWGDCVIRDVDTGTVSVIDVSSSMVLLSDGAVYSLKTGELIRDANIESIFEYFDYNLTDRYLIITYRYYEGFPEQLYEKYYVFDEYGNLRYYSNRSQVKPGRGDLILLKRGPYIGLADLNGEWVLKTVDPEIKRDAEALHYWY